MKQEFIGTFLAKIANKLTIDEKIELHKQLQTCDDKAFALLMSHNKFSIKKSFWRGVLWGISVASAIASLGFFILCIVDYWADDWVGGLIICIMFFAASFAPAIGWYKKAHTKQLYEDYLKIIQAYQENTKVTK